MNTANFKMGMETIHRDLMLFQEVFATNDGTGIDVAIFWSATEIQTSKAWTLSLTNDTGFLDKTWAFKQEGLSVRCIKNSSASKRVQRVIR